MHNASESDQDDHAEHDHDHSGHDHGHGGHGHHGHSHGAGVTDEKRIGWAFIIIFSFMIIEVIGGIYAGSLALLADAGHMVSDAIALAMSCGRAARRQAGRQRQTYLRLQTPRSAGRLREWLHAFRHRGLDRV